MLEASSRPRLYMRPGPHTGGFCISVSVQLEDRLAQVPLLPEWGAQPPTPPPRGKQVELPARACGQQCLQAMHREAFWDTASCWDSQNPPPKSGLRVLCHQPGFCMMSLPIQHPV